MVEPTERAADQFLPKPTGSLPPASLPEATCKGHTHLTRQSRTDRCRWLTEHMLPHEPWLRSWLSHQYRIGAQEIDDIVQSSFLRLLETPDVSHIDRPRGYLRQTAWSIIANAAQRKKIIGFEQVACELLEKVACDKPLADDIADGRAQLRRLGTEMDRLPARLRDVFILRRIDGLPQRDTAMRLMLSESAVEKYSHIAILKLSERCGRTSLPQAADIRQATDHHFPV